jgi:hypothetical protein
MFVNSFYLPQIDQLTLPCFILGMNVGCVRELGWSGLGWPVFVWATVLLFVDWHFS